MKERIFYFDTIKFILIYLVVLGHVLEPNRALSWNSEIYTSIYLFHMPLFIILSGYFTKKKEDFGEFKQDSFRLLETFIVLHIFSVIFQITYYGIIKLSSLLVPGFASWYLLSLFFWRCFLQYIPNKLLIIHVFYESH